MLGFYLHLTLKRALVGLNRTCHIIKRIAKHFKLSIACDGYSGIKLTVFKLVIGFYQLINRREHQLMQSAHANQHNNDGQYQREDLQVLLPCLALLVSVLQLTNKTVHIFDITGRNAIKRLFILRQ